MAASIVAGKKVLGLTTYNIRPHWPLQLTTYN